MSLLKTKDREENLKAARGGKRQHIQGITSWLPWKKDSEMEYLCAGSYWWVLGTEPMGKYRKQNWAERC